MSRTITPKHAWLVWLLAVSFYGYEFFLQISPNVMVSELMQAFNADAAMVGNLAAFYFYSYAAMQIPVGILHDKFGPRRLLFAASLICGLGAFIFGASHSLHDAEFGRLLIGFGSAFAVIGVFKIAATWFPMDRFALVSGATLSVAMLGAVAAGAPLAWLVHGIGWRYAMMILSSLGLVIAVVILLFVRDKPIVLPNNHAQDVTIKQSSIISGIHYVIRQPQSWLISIYAGLMFAPIPALSGLWGVPFIMHKYVVDRPTAAFSMSMVFIGFGIGAPLLGWISDTMRNRKSMPTIGSIGALITILIILYVQLSLTGLFIMTFLFGFFTSGFMPTFSMMREHNPANTSATAMGFMNMLNMIGAAILQPFIGWMLDINWQGKIENHIRVFKLHDYHIALAVLPIFIGISILMLPFLRETHCEQQPLQDI